MSIRIDAGQGERFFPYDGLVRWPLAGWLVLLVAFALVWASGNELPFLVPFTSSLIVVGVVTVVFLALSQLVLVPVGLRYLVKSRGAPSLRAVLAVVCGMAHLAVALFALWALTSAYALHAA